MSTPPGGPTRDTTGAGGQSGAAPGGTADRASTTDTEQTPGSTGTSTVTPGPARTDVDTEGAGGGPGHHGVSPGEPGSTADTTQAGPPGSTGPAYRAPGKDAPAQEADTTRTDAPVTDGTSGTGTPSGYDASGRTDTSGYGSPNYGPASGGSSVPSAMAKPTVTAGSHSATVNYVVPTELSAPAAPTGAASGTGGSLGAATYKYKVVAKNALGHSAASAASADIVVASGTTNKVTLSITAVAGATSYDVYGRTGGAFLKIGNTTTTSFVDDGSVTPTGAPPAVTGVLYGSSPVTGIEVEGSTGGTTLGRKDATSVVVNNLTPNREYTFRVRAVNGAGGGPWSPTSDPVTPTL